MYKNGKNRLNQLARVRCQAKGGTRVKLSIVRFGEPIRGHRDRRGSTQLRAASKMHSIRRKRGGFLRQPVRSPSSMTSYAALLRVAKLS
jgi:hypothetical protein